MLKTVHSYYNRNKIWKENYEKNQAMDEQTLTVNLLRTSSYFLDTYCDLAHTWSGIRTYDLSRKILEKWSVFLCCPSRYLTSAILYCYKNRIRPITKFNCYKLNNLASLEFPFSVVSKYSFVSLSMINHFLPYNPFHDEETSQDLSLLYRYFHGKCSDNIHSLVPSLLNLMVRTRHTSHIVVTYRHSLRFQLV